MSAIDAINRLALTLRSLAGSATEDALGLIRASGQAIGGLNPWDIDRVKYSVRRPGGADYQGGNLTAGEIEAPTVPKPSDLAVHPMTVTAFAGIPPSLPTLKFDNIPQIQWPDGAPGRPSIRQPTLTPQEPGLATGLPMPEGPAQPQLFTAEVVALELPPNVDPLPDPPDFAYDPAAAFDQGLGLVRVSTSQIQAFVEKQRALVEKAKAALLGQLRAALSGQGPLPSGWDRLETGLSLVDIEARRRSGLEALDLADPGSQTGMPTGARIAQKLEVEFDALRALVQAASQAAQARNDRNVRHLIWAVETAGRVGPGLMELRFREIDYIIDAWDTILDGGEAALMILRKWAEWEKTRVDWALLYNALQVKRIKALVAREKTKIEKIKVDMGNDDAITLHNRQLFKAYPILGKFFDARIALFERQVEWITGDIEWRTAEWKAYRLDVERHLTLARRAVVERGLLHARIAQDELRIAAEEQKIQLYTAQLEPLDAEAGLAVTQAQQRKTINDGVLEQYATEVETYARIAQTLDQQMRHAASALIKEADSELSEARLELEAQADADSKALWAATLKLQHAHTGLMAKIKQHERLIRMSAARGNAQVDAARTMGGVAMEAESGFNAVGVLDLTKEE